MPNPPQPTQIQTQINGDRDAKRGNSTAAARPQYEEAQNDEIEVLKSIYMDDYEPVETKGAWSKAEKSFSLKLRSYSNPTEDPSVLLCATLTATYPKSQPILSLKDVQGVRETPLESIRKILVSKPKEMLGEVIIHEIATAIQDVLEDAATNVARDRDLPSLEEERVKSEAVATKLAQEKEEEVLRRQQQHKEEEELKMQRMLEEERKRREEARRSRRSNPADPEVAVDDSMLPELGTPTEVMFDQSINLKGKSTVTFRSAQLISVIGTGRTTEVFLAKPNPSRISSPFVVLKRAKVSGGGPKLSMLKLERELEKLKRLHHESSLNVLGFSIDTKPDEWVFDILVEYGSSSPLKAMLVSCESLPVPKVRSSAIDLLQALDFYHKNGLIHGDIHPGNVFYCESPNGTQIKLGDVQFQSTLHSLGAETKVKDFTTPLLPSSWMAPEFNESEGPTRKSDVWHIGVLIIQMLFGLTITRRYQSPATFMNGASLSEPFQDFVRDIFKEQSQRRPTAFDLIPYEFLRTDVNAVSHETSLASSRLPSSANLQTVQTRKPRQLSSSSPATFSRYASEWDESARLGKGGYGEVVKARNKLDGRIYAIKKISNKTPSELTQVLSEVYLLATLNHPYVVRYYTAWPEEEHSSHGITLDEVMSSAETSYLSPDQDKSSAGFDQSTGGLDFISSSGYPKIEFGDDEDDDEDDEKSSDEGSSESENDLVLDGKHSPPMRSSNALLELQRTRSSSRALVKSTLYIQMEYCERLTLRDVIRKGLPENNEEIWRLLRQILEGLAHIHSHGIIHRDLKPENIFIDVGDNPKIGDFGLAKSGASSVAEKTIGSGRHAHDDMTRSVGTTLYVAPELRSNVGGTYNSKVDMYSLGIILFEMCHTLGTGMERLQVISNLRQRDHSLPPDLQSSGKVALGDIIEALIKHRPGERPSSAELLQSGQLPVPMEDETVRLALKQLSDAHSPYHHKMMTALFAQNDSSEVKNHLWRNLADSQAINASNSYLLLQKFVKTTLTSCYERHGAVEVHREALFPLSNYYSGNNNVEQLLDESGTLVQLPFDLTLPHARAIAEQPPAPEKTYTFGAVFRKSPAGGAPRSSRETDFDIVTYNGKDLALQEAEVVKVMDEILQEIPALKNTPMCFHISHSDLLEIIMEFCRIPISQRPQVKEILGKLNIQQWNWQKIRNELRAPSIGISTISLDEMAQFDFRDPADRCFTKLQAIFKGSVHLPKLHTIFTHISGLVEYLKRMGIKHKIFCSPLSSFNDMFYRGGIMFQCLFDTKKKDILAAGGRYDSLIEAHRERSTRSDTRPGLHAVGIKIAWDRLVTIMVRHQRGSGSTNAFLKNSEPNPAEHDPPRRCDCLVASFDPSVLRSRGVKMVADLWAQDISAELATDTGSPEELLNRYKDEKHSWIIIIKNEALASGKPDLKIKSMETREDADVRSADLLSYFRAEFREREQREGAAARVVRHALHQPHAEQATRRRDGKNPVQVLTANHKSKKANKYRVVEAAQNAAQEAVEAYLEAPVASVETRDEYLEMMQSTRLSDPDSWRRVLQDVPLQDRAYLQEVHELVETFKTQYADSRKCFVYNFRTGKCIDYDLRL